MNAQSLVRVLIFQTVREKYNKNKRAIELLSAGKEEIEKAIPSGSGCGVSGNSSATINLKKLMEQVSTWHTFTVYLDGILMLDLVIECRSKQLKRNAILSNRSSSRLHSI